MELEKVFLSDMQNLKTVFRTFTAGDKYSVLNRHNLTESYQMQLSLKKTTFSDIFYEALKSRLKFEHFF